MKIRWFFLYAFLFLQVSLLAQKTVNLDSLNTLYEIQALYASSITTSTTNPTSINIEAFNKELVENPKFGNSYWSMFKINCQSDISINYVEFLFPLADKINLYVPVFDKRYKKYTVGLSSPNGKVKNLKETSSLFITTEDIDLQAPFYIENIPISVFGVNAFNEQSFMIAYQKKPITRSESFRELQLIQIKENFGFIILFGMVILSFVFMLIHYLLHKRAYFLSYTLYLFFLMVIYAGRTSYFFNIYSGFGDYLYLFLYLNAQLLGILSYTFFLKQFVGMKENYPKLYVIYRKYIYAFIFFIVLYNVMVIKNPFYQFIDIVSKSAIYLIGGINVVFVLYMFIKKRLIHTTIVFIGSVILLLGFVVAAITSDSLIMAPIVVIETILFMGAISYLDMKNFKKAMERDKLKQFSEFKSRLFANIAHELRTPLTLINVPIDQRLQHTETTEKDRIDFEMMKRNSARLLTLVDQFLQAGAIESQDQHLSIQQGDAITFIKLLADSFIQQAEQKQIHYTVETKKNEDVWYDEDVVGKITTNLMANAIKYTPIKGTISCKGYIDEGMLYLVMKNTGKGLSKEQQEKIFERFYRIDETQPGSGIGLAHAKELAALHKGTIHVESNVNSWTTFKAILPVSRETFGGTEIDDHPEKELTSLYQNITVPYIENIDDSAVREEEEGKPIVLIIDDNDDIRNLLIDVFKKDYEIKTADDGEKGVILALEHIPDLIISDVMMPVKDGLALTKELKNDERTSHIPIILLTAKVGEQNELTGIETGADDYITKPFNIKILISKVENSIKLRQKLQEKYLREPGNVPDSTVINKTDRKFWNKVNTVMQKRLTDDEFSVKEFSIEIGMSRNHLYRKLIALTGLSPSKFITVKRLKLAARLLRQPDLNISEIAYDIGFNNVSYFNKSFKEMYGCTPTEYAKKLI